MPLRAFGGSPSGDAQPRKRSPTRSRSPMNSSTRARSNRPSVTQSSNASIASSLAIGGRRPRGAREREPPGSPSPGGSPAGSRAAGWGSWRQGGSRWVGDGDRSKEGDLGSVIRNWGLRLAHEVPRCRRGVLVRSKVLQPGRVMAKRQLKREAILLRKRGLSYAEIQEHVSVSKSTILGMDPRALSHRAGQNPLLDLHSR